MHRTGQGVARIDLNADLGEGQGDDSAMLACVSSASICCGAHAGGPDILRATLRAAAAAGVTAGAHPGFADRPNFGRVAVPMSAAEVESLVAGQVADAAQAAADEGTTLAYVKAHGALYNLAAVDADVALAVARGVRAVDPGLVLLGLAGSQQLRHAAGLRTAAEAFADRAYLPDGTLAPRGRAGAVLDDPAVVVERAVRMAVDGTLVATDGRILAPDVDSLCLHGDTPGAVTMAFLVKMALTGAGVAIRPFAGPAA